MLFKLYKSCLTSQQKDSCGAHRSEQRVRRVPDVHRPQQSILKAGLKTATDWNCLVTEGRRTSCRTWSFMQAYSSEDTAMWTYRDRSEVDPSSYQLGSQGGSALKSNCSRWTQAPKLFSQFTYTCKNNKIINEVRRRIENNKYSRTISIADKVYITRN